MDTWLNVNVSNNDEFYKIIPIFHNFMLAAQKKYFLNYKFIQFAE